MFSLASICSFTTYSLIYLPLRCNGISIMSSYMAWPNKAFYLENGVLGTASLSPCHLPKTRSNGLVTSDYFLQLVCLYIDVSFGNLNGKEGYTWI